MTYARAGMERVLAGSVNPVLSVTFADQYGDAADAAGVVTCTLTRADGSSIATARATTNPAGTGTYAVALTTAEALTLDVIRAVWLDGASVRATTYHRVVGGYLFTTAELVAMGGLSGYTTAELRATRDQITDLFELHTGVSWCPAYDLHSFIGNNSYRQVTFRPLRAVRSCTIDDATEPVADFEVDADAGIVDAETPFYDACSLGVEHGFDAPPADLRDAALLAAKDRLLRRRSALSDRARSVTDDMGTRVFAFAGKGHPTGIDEVDAVLAAYDYRTPGIG
jgi:hypothetical protein